MATTTNYLNNKDLYYEIIVSKASGKLTRKAEKMLELLGNKTHKKMRYWNNDDRLDCLQGGLLDMYANWYNFNSEKSKNAFAYFTEIFKRGMIKNFNDLFKKRGVEGNVKTISIQSANDGQGMQNF